MDYKHTGGGTMEPLTDGGDLDAPDPIASGGSQDGIANDDEARRELQRERLVVMDELTCKVQKLLEIHQKSSESRNGIALTLRVQAEVMFFARTSLPQSVFCDTPESACSSMRRDFVANGFGNSHYDYILEAAAAALGCRIKLYSFTSMVVQIDLYNQAMEVTEIELFMHQNKFYPATSTDHLKFSAKAHNKHCFEITFATTRLGVYAIQMTNKFSLSNPMAAVARACVFKKCSSVFDGTAVISEEELQMPISNLDEDKDPLLKQAEINWDNIRKNIPVDLQDHTKKDAMGTTNLGTLFKAILLVLRFGCLTRSCQTIVIISARFWYRGDTLVEVGTGPAKSTTSLGTIAGVDVTIVGFERDERQFECAQTVLMHAREQGMLVKVQLI
jgi:hypothetical protein